MRRTMIWALALVLATASAAQLAAQAKSVMVGGAAMLPSRNIVENAMHSQDHTTLMAAVKAAGLVETLQSKGPFTVFAPTNAAFAKLPAGTVDTLLQPANKTTLQSVLTYHVVAGAMDAKALMAAIAKGNGKSELKTVAGGSLWVIQNADGLWLQDGKGTRAKITIADVFRATE